MRINKEYMGSASLTPMKEVTAGEFSTWTLTFVAGEYGIDDGGSMVICWKSVSDWDTPQFDEPMEPGFCSVTTTGQCKIKACYHKFVRPFGNSILLDITGGYMKKGDIITVVMGDTSQGSLGMRAQSFCETEHEIRVYLDPCGTNRYEELPGERIKLKIVPAYHHEIQAIVPATVVKGDPFEIAIRAIDEFGNPTPKYNGKVKLAVVNGAGENIPAEISFPEGTNGVYKIPGCKITTEGFWSLRITDEENHYDTYSNGSKCVVDSSTKKLFWGDMHGQTKQTVGTGLLDDYYTFARDKALISFAGWQGNDFEISNETWADIRKYTKKYNEEGKFLVYLGYEWSGTTPQGGDHNVYFLDDNEDFYPSSNWTQLEVDPKNNANPITELHSKFNGRKDAMLIPHIGGRYANLAYLNRDYTSVIEIHSHHGTFEWFAFDAMKQGLKVGFIATSDDHTCRLGLSYPLSGHGKSASGAFDVTSGLTGVYADELNKKTIWNSIKSRHCYASTTDRVYLDTDVNGIGMGDEGKTTKPVLQVEACGRFPLESIEVYDWDKKVYAEQLLPADKKKIRIRWSGVVYRGRGKSAKWDGIIYVQNGKIKSAEKYAYDRIDQGIVIKSDQYVKFTSSTSGDYDGLILELEANDDTVIKFSSQRGTVCVTYKEVVEKGFEQAMGGLNLKLEMGAATMDMTVAEYASHLAMTKSLAMADEKGEHAYWVRILQTNGNAAWSSPIFVEIE